MRKDLRENASRSEREWVNVLKGVTSDAMPERIFVDGRIKRGSAAMER
jgi:hypothetical protein